MVQGSNPGREKLCFLLQEHPDWLWGPPGYQGSFLRVKQLGHEVNSSPFSAKVKNKCTHTSTPPICLHDKDRKRNLPFTFLVTLAEHKDNEDSTWATAQRDLMQCSVWLWHSRTRLTKCPLYQNWVHQTLQCSGNRSRPITHTIWWMCFSKTNDPNFASLTNCADVRWDSRQFRHMSS